MKGVKSIRSELDQHISRKEEEERAVNAVSIQVQRQVNFLEMHEATYQRLSGYLKKYADFEKQLKTLRKGLQHLEDEKSLELQKHRVSEKDMMYVNENLSRIKSYQRLISVLQIIIGATLLSTSFIISIFLLAPGIPLIVPGVIFFRRYQHLKVLACLNVSIKSLVQNIMQRKLKIEELSRDFDKLKAKAGFNSSAEIESKITDIMVALRFGIGVVWRLSTS